MTRVAVYAIAKNEAKNVDRWLESAALADQIVVLDTGSTDGTYEALCAYRDDGGPANMIVERRVFDPWRFDHARNAALDLVDPSMDVCLSLDFDEVMVGPPAGWASEVRAVWRKYNTRLAYRYVWSFDAAGKPYNVFPNNDIHSRHGCRWILHTHETLYFDRPESAGWLANVEMHHHQDRAKKRPNDLALLGAAVIEFPDNARAAHYHARELMWARQYDAATREALRHLTLPDAWMPERVWSMKFIAECCARQGRMIQAEEWFRRAAAEGPQFREPVLALAVLLAGCGDRLGAIAAIERARAIRPAPECYLIDPAVWNDDVLNRMTARVMRSAAA